MQTVWSRIAQTRISCHCPSCVSTAGGVARRATTTTGRRPVRLAISSTFIYSGIFAAAATTDAGFKQKRRDQWDRAIADIKHDLENTQEERDGAEETVRYTPITEEPLEALLEAASGAHHSPIWPTNTGTRLVQRNLPPQSIYATDRQRHAGLLRRWTPKKLRMTELEMDKFILRMLLHLDDLGMRTVMPSTVPESIHPFFLAPIDELKALLVYTDSQYHVTASVDADTDVSSLPPQHQYGVTYLQDDKGEYRQTARNLNSALGTLFEKRRDNNLSHAELIAKICYNLSVSSAAPTLDCWNTLLTGLMENGQDSTVAWHAINAIRHSNTRINETTMTSILKYYTAINNPVKFADFVDSMRGLNGGLACARKDITINHRGSARIYEDPATGKIVQKPYPTPGVFEALINGVLRFVGFDAALRVCRDMGSEGWGLSIRSLTLLLDDRASKADWETGCQVWEQIKHLRDESKAKGQAERLFPQTYTAMLRLCSVCNETQKFDETLREALAARHSQRKLMSLFRHERQQRPSWKLPSPTITSYKSIDQSVTKEDLGKVVPKEYSYMTPPSTTLAETQPSAEASEVSETNLEEDWLGESPTAYGATA